LRAPTHPLPTLFPYTTLFRSSAKRIEQQSMTKAAEGYALGPTRVQFQNKDPRGWREFADQLAEHSTQGAALTLRGVQKARPSLRSEEHTSELQSRVDLVCRLL